MQPKFVFITNAGDPMFPGRIPFWIGHFQARARQLTPQAFERAIDSAVKKPPV